MGHALLKEQIVDLSNGKDVTIKELGTSCYPGDASKMIALLVAQDFEKENFIEGLRAIGMAAIKQVNSTDVELEILVRQEWQGQGVEIALVERATLLIEERGLKLSPNVRETGTLVAAN